MRKLLGGGMRQVGVLAAAGLVALTEMVDRLAEDHARARRLAEGLAALPGVDLDPAAHPHQHRRASACAPSASPGPRALPPSQRFVGGMRERGVLCGAFGSFEVRMVTHYEIADADIDAALARRARGDGGVREQRRGRLRRVGSAGR